MARRMLLFDGTIISYIFVLSIHIFVSAGFWFSFDFLCGRLSGGMSW